MNLKRPSNGIAMMITMLITIGELMMMMMMMMIMIMIIGNLSHVKGPLLCS